METLYLAKYIAQCGAAARRKAADLVKAGKVTVNGRVITDPAFSIDPKQDQVVYDSRVLELPAEKIYIMLNKPRGYTTSHADKHAEHLAVELIDCPEAQRLLPAGRLDKDSEGLLIFSNDGSFIQQITHPRYNVIKRYKVTASRELDEKCRQRMLNGIKDENDLLKALKVTPCPNEKFTYYIELNEGKKREIRRMLKACGAATQRLQRIAMDKIELGNLPTGKWRPLTPDEVKTLLAAAKLME